MSFSRLLWQCMWYPLGSLSSRRMGTECRLCNRVKPHRLLCQFHPRIPHLGHIENKFRHRLWCMNKKFRAIVETMQCHKQMHFTPRGRKVCPHIFFQPDQKLWSHDFFLCAMTRTTISEIYGLKSPGLCSKGVKSKCFKHHHSRFTSRAIDLTYFWGIGVNVQWC